MDFVEDLHTAQQKPKGADMEAEARVTLINASSSSLKKQLNNRVVSIIPFKGRQKLDLSNTAMNIDVRYGLHSP